MRFCQQLNAWMVLSISRLCRYANYDPSTIFRFRSGARQPAEPERFAQAVAAYVSQELDDVQHRKIAGELPRLTEQAFAQFSPSLPLSGLFYGQDVPYTYEAYLAHLAQTEAFAAEHPRYELEFTGGGAFRNLQICIHEGQWAMVSKERSPAIHFVIRHPKLRAAIERFVPPMVEE